MVKGRVARFWNMMPWDFTALEPTKAGYLHALYQVEQECEAYYKSEQAKRLDNISNS